MWIVSERDTFQVLTTLKRALSLFRSSSPGYSLLSFPLRTSQNWYVTSKAVIPRHAWVGNSTSRIWGTDKRSKLGVSFCTKRFRKAIPLSPLDLTNGVPPATVCIAARLHPRFKAYTSQPFFGWKSCASCVRSFAVVTDGRCVEMKCQAMICCGRLRLNVDL